MEKGAAFPHCFLNSFPQNPLRGKPVCPGCQDDTRVQLSPSPISRGVHVTYITDYEGSSLCM